MAFPSVCLVVLDGWGLAPPSEGNAIEQADTPVFDGIWDQCPHTTLVAKGTAVGLPEGQMGNSEVGHLNLGAGAVVKQDLLRIDEAIEEGTLGDVPALQAAFRDAPRVHLVGLVSDGGVHASERHVQALLELAAEWGIEDLVVHAFTDGRDTSPTGGARYLAELEATCRELGVGRVASVVGRYYAMDRDQRWERVQQAYDLLAHGRGAHTADTAEQAARDAYDRDETDEFITATVVGEPAPIRPGDSVLCFNFRPDRVRELTQALADPAFTEVDRSGAAVVERYTTLTRYEDGWTYPVVFDPERPRTTIAKVLAEAGLRQLHVAETEKYPHVTFFFNGGEEDAYEGEERFLAPSPRDVPTYDHKPEMSCKEATDGFLEHYGAGDAPPAFCVFNYANPDMVGHTGSIPATIAAVEAVDAQLGRVLDAVHARGGACIVTADHGNADELRNPDGSPQTAHSLNPVPFVVTRGAQALDPEGGALCDVAPTALQLLGVEQPAEMTGRSLITEPADPAS